MLKITNLMTVSPFVLASLFSETVQAVFPVDIRLTTAKTVFNDSEPVDVVIAVTNTSGVDAYVSKGFFAGDFHLDIDLNGPDGNIRPFSTVGSPEPLGPLNLLDSDGIPRPAIPCERIVPFDLVTGDGQTFRIVDLRAYYPISASGAYTAKVKTPVELFSGFVEHGETGEVFCFLDDTARMAFNPLESNTIKFSIQPQVRPAESQINVSATLLKIGTGMKPPVTKIPIKGMRIELYALDEIPVDLKPVNHKVYGLVSDSGLVNPVQVRFTASNGNAAFGPVEQAGYVLIGIHQDATDTRFVGAKIADDDANWADQIDKKLNVMILPDGKKAPGKTRRLTGSELLITQPEYIEWDSSQQSYPFVFESEGEWDVMTTVELPEGLVVDAVSLSATVNNELEAVLFTIDDVGTIWDYFGVTYDVKHKKKTKKIKDKIGVHLDKEFSRKIKPGIYGASGSPEDFFGGKKIKKDNKTPSKLDPDKSKLAVH